MGLLVFNIHNIFILIGILAVSNIITNIILYSIKKIRKIFGWGNDNPREYEFEIVKDSDPIRLNQDEFPLDGSKGNEFRLVAYEKKNNNFRKIKVSSPEVIWSHRGDKNLIKIPATIFKTLFPKIEPADENPSESQNKEKVYLIIEPAKVHFMERFWSNGDPAVKIANRMGIFIALAFLIIELGFDFVPTEWRQYLLGCFGFIFLALTVLAFRK